MTKIDPILLTALVEAGGDVELAAQHLQRTADGLRADLAAAGLSLGTAPEKPPSTPPAPATAAPEPPKPKAPKYAPGPADPAFSDLVSAMQHDYPMLDGTPDLKLHDGHAFSTNGQPRFLNQRRPPSTSGYVLPGRPGADPKPAVQEPFLGKLAHKL